MISPTPQEQADTLRRENDALIEWLTKAPLTHAKNAVLRLQANAEDLRRGNRAKDAEIGRLTAERDDHMAANLEFDTKLAVAEAQIKALQIALVEAAIKLEALLMASPTEDGQHEDDCPAGYRPALAQALSTEDAEIDRLRKALSSIADLADELLESFCIAAGSRWSEYEGNAEKEARDAKVILAKVRAALNPDTKEGG